ncbi:MAG: hypothetical protein HY319_02425, partial [Armatimonadetes bacterium]|nr:hypothetical protein [Armatimonadota bacterium]
MVLLRWTCLVALALLLAAPAFAGDGQCKRCGVWVAGAGPDPWGMSGRVLCELCKDPERRCDEALDALRDRISGAEDNLRRWHQLEAAGDPDPNFLATLHNAILDLELDLAEMRALLARLEQECAGQGSSDMAQNLNPGTRPGTGSNERRDAPTGSEPVDR